MLTICGINGYFCWFPFSRHDVAEIAGLAAYSFGEEEVDRAVTVYKKEFAPCEEELAVLRRGGEWDPVKAKEEALQVLEI